MSDETMQGRGGEDRGDGDVGIYFIAGGGQSKFYFITNLKSFLSLLIFQKAFSVIYTYVKLMMT